MIEPFKRVRPYERILDEEGNPVPNFHISRLTGSCYMNYYNDLTRPLPILPALSKIFDDGNEVHWEKEILWKGARCIIGIEDYWKVVHESQSFTISTLYDRLEQDWNGIFLRDWKSTEIGGFYYFLSDYMKRNFPEDYIFQLSGEAYLVYIHKGKYITEGVISKVDKNQHRNELSLTCELYPLERIRGKLLRHPVIHAILGRIEEDQLIELCIDQMSQTDENGNNKSWKCTNCQYNHNNGAETPCPVKRII